MDDAAVKRAQAVLDKKGIKVGVLVLREAIEAAQQPPPPPIPVSIGMIEAGRTYWKLHPDAPLHVMLPEMYRAMEKKRLEEEAAAQIKGP